MSDHYDQMDYEALARHARVRGCGDKLEVFTSAPELRDYLRDLDWDQAYIAQWEDSR